MPGKPYQIGLKFPPAPSKKPSGQGMRAALARAGKISLSTGTTLPSEMRAKLNLYMSRAHAEAHAYASRFPTRVAAPAPPRPGPGPSMEQHRSTLTLGSRWSSSEIRELRRMEEYSARRIAQSSMSSRGPGYDILGRAQLEKGGVTTITSPEGKVSFVNKGLEKDVQILGLEETVQNIRIAASAAVYVTTIASKAAAWAVFEESQKHVPFRFGFLFYSGFVEKVKGAYEMSGAESAWDRLRRMHGDAIYNRLQMINQAMGGDSSRDDKVYNRIWNEVWRGNPSESHRAPRTMSGAREILTQMSTAVSGGGDESSFSNVEGTEAYRFHPYGAARTAYMLASRTGTPVPITKWAIIYTADHAWVVHENPDAISFKSGKPYQQYPTEPKWDHYLQKAADAKYDQLGNNTLNGLVALMQLLDSTMGAKTYGRNVRMGVPTFAVGTRGPSPSVGSIGGSEEVPF